jgi:hypothetical protein
VATSSLHLPSIIQIRNICIVFLGSLLAIYLGWKVGDSELKFVFGILFIIFLASVMIALGTRAWLVVPLGMTLNVPVPISFGRDFSSRECVIMLLMAHTFFQVLLKRQNFKPFQRNLVWVHLYIGWVFFIFAMNPTGLAIFGSENVGARFYFQIFLGWASLVMLSSSPMTERDIIWIFIIMLGGWFLNMIYGIVFYEGTPAEQVLTMMETETFYTWHQAMSTPALFLLMFLFSKIPINQLLSLRGLKMIPGFLLGLGMILASGKRAALASVLAFPFFATLLRRQLAVGVILTAIAFSGIGILVIGQGKFFSLPLSVQRALSILPGKWDPAAQKGLEDDFRQILREDAMRRIEQDPIIGKGIGINATEFFTDVYSGSGKIISGIRAGGSWHTTWLGTAADFGIPGAFFFGMIWLTLTIGSWKMVSRLPEGSYYQTFAGFIFILLCWQWMNSWTSGDSAGNVLNWFWIYGLLYALWNQMGSILKNNADSTS